jgi:Xaa-Pro aminopeptidase
MREERLMRIPEREFRDRILRIQEAMGNISLDAVAVYGDEYRRENLRYVSNFWPIFERAMLFVPKRGNPVLAGAPEGERYALEMTPWCDYRNVKEFACVSVPEEIDYPLADFTSLRDILRGTLMGGHKRLGASPALDTRRL